MSQYERAHLLRTTAVVTRKSSASPDPHVRENGNQTVRLRGSHVPFQTAFYVSRDDLDKEHRSDLSGSLQDHYRIVG